MKVGAVFSQADSGTDPVAIRRFATDIEAAGYGHLMAYDHMLGAPASSFPSPVGSFPSAPYTNEHTFHEILVLFSHLAAATSVLEFVTSVLVLPQRQTAAAAKQIATIQLLSGGRMHATFDDAADIASKRPPAVMGVRHYVDRLGFTGLSKRRHPIL